MKSEPQKINALAVKLHNQQIGIINRLAGDRHLFSFEQDYIDNPQRPTLSLSFKGQTNGIVTNTRIFNLRLPPFFSNLLPEGHLRSYLAQRAGVKPEREFFLLSALGADLPGALIIAPLDHHDDTQEAIQTQQKSRLNNTALRFSLAGIQLKFSAMMASSSGLTIPADGMNGSWIVKLPSQRFTAVPENEFVMLALAHTIGITTPEHLLIDIRDINGLPDDVAHMQGNALAIKRFDRSHDGQRIHMEDFAQIFGLFPESKYDRRSYANIASVLWVEAGETAAFEFIRRLVFSVLVGNADMHLKNWSILYLDKRTPSLSPAYDLVSTIPYIPDDKLALNFGGSRSLNEITADQVRRFADSARLPVSPITQLITETIERTVTAWDALAQKELLSTDIKNIIGKQIQTTAKKTWANFR